MFVVIVFFKPATVYLSFSNCVITNMFLDSTVISGTILSVTLPALYNKYEAQVDRCAGTIHRSFSRHYKIVDENVMNRLPRNVPKDKPM